MQIYADVIGQPMLIAGSPQTPALGVGDRGRRHRRRRPAATRLRGGAGADDDAQGEALRRRTRRRRASTTSSTAIYRELHDSFGGVAGAKADFATLMKRLLAIRERETAQLGGAHEQGWRRRCASEVYRANLELAAQRPRDGHVRQRVGRRPRGRAHGDQAERRALRRADAGAHGAGLARDRRGRRTRTCAPPPTRRRTSSCTARSVCGGIVHTHSEYATAFAQARPRRSAAWARRTPTTSAATCR